MNKFLENLKHEAEENPTIALAVGAALIGSIGKLVKAHGESKGSRAYAKQIDWKIKKDRRK